MDREPQLSSRRPSAKLSDGVLGAVRLLKMLGRVTLCIPVFNESSIIVDYLREIESELHNFELKVILIDDCSTDETVLRIKEANFGEFVTVITNSVNQGHGPSVVAGLRAALHADCEVIVTVDGDAEISAAEIHRVLVTLNTEGADVVEGHRQQRVDPAFRKVVSLVARVLIFIVGGRAMWSAKDANSPVRAYQRAALVEILGCLHPDERTPNLFISMIARKAGMQIEQIEVNCRKVHAERVQGTTWRARFKNIPSRRFLVFCTSATFDVLRFGSRLRRR